MFYRKAEGKKLSAPRVSWYGKPIFPFYSKVGLQLLAAKDNRLSMNRRTALHSS